MTIIYKILFYALQPSQMLLWCFAIICSFRLKDNTINDGGGDINNRDDNYGEIVKLQSSAFYAH